MTRIIDEHEMESYYGKVPRSTREAFGESSAPLRRDITFREDNTRLWVGIAVVLSIVAGITVLGIFL